jgi:hypothetical protein
VVEHLSSKHKALSSNPSTAQKWGWGGEGIAQVRSWVQSLVPQKKKKNLIQCVIDNYIKTYYFPK